ncbi:MAG TPA: hypothetical protein VIL52_07155 [Bacteroidota bacterium]
MTNVDLCPICGVLREMNVTGYRTTYTGAHGDSNIVLTRAYHCAMCCSFVRCENVEDTEENLAGVLLDDELSGQEHVVV